MKLNLVVQSKVGEVSLSDRCECN